MAKLKFNLKNLMLTSKDLYNLKEKIKVIGYKNFSKDLGINEDTLKNKLRGLVEFKINEIDRMTVIFQKYKKITETYRKKNFYVNENQLKNITEGTLKKIVNIEILETEIKEIEARKYLKSNIYISVNIAINCYKANILFCVTYGDKKGSIKRDLTAARTTTFTRFCKLNNLNTEAIIQEVKEKSKAQEIWNDYIDGYFKERKLVQCSEPFENDEMILKTINLFELEK